MANYRVIKSVGHGGEGFVYSIEDVYQGDCRDVHPFVKHVTLIPVGNSVDDLRDELNRRHSEMMEAFEKPVLFLRPERLEEI